MEALFSLGMVVQTRRIAEQRAVEPTFDFLCEKALQMHAAGNWGDICDEDWALNQEALCTDERLFSSYWLDDTHTEKIWVITEADRSATTILFPDEY